MNYFFDTEFIEGMHKPLFGKKRHFIDLISIGIVSEDGRELYAVSKEFDVKKAYANDWVRENVVLPIFFELAVHEFFDGHFKDEWLHEQQPVTYPVFRKNTKWVWNQKWLKRLLERYGKSHEEIKRQIVAFVGGEFCGYGTLHPFVISTDNTRGFPVDFYGYYADYDWVVLASLFGSMNELPLRFPMYARDLKQMLDEKQETYVEELIPTMRVVDNVPFHESVIRQRAERICDLKNLNTFPKNNNEHNALADAKWNKELYHFLQQLPV